MIEFKPLASSSAGCCYMLSAEGLPPLIIDAGIPFDEIQIGTGFSLSQVAGCLVSHAHGDHCKAVKQLLRYGVKVYAHPSTWLLMQVRHPFARLVEPLKGIEVGGWTVAAFEAEHDLEGTLGFVIEGGDAKCLYLTDSAFCRYKFDGLTHLFVECNHDPSVMRENVVSGRMHASLYKRSAVTHMSIDRLVEMLRANDLSKAREIHLLHLSDKNSDAESMRRKVREATGVPTYVAAKRGVF